MPAGETYHDLKRLLRGLNLNTVAEEAHRPNMGECWARDGDDHDPRRLRARARAGSATSRPAGRRGSTTTSLAGSPSRSRPGLEHVVVTSVDRDELADGGAAVFAETIRRQPRGVPGLVVEVLIPDFDGDGAPLRGDRGGAGDPQPQSRDGAAAVAGGSAARPV